jgi:RNA recognition motif-containing protein
MRDPETGNSRGFAFVGYDSFEAADASIEAMNGQFLCNRQINVTYAYKKDTKGERHGTVAGAVLLHALEAMVPSRLKTYTHKTLMRRVQSGSWLRTPSGRDPGRTCCSPLDPLAAAAGRLLRPGVGCRQGCRRGCRPR